MFLNKEHQERISRLPDYIASENEICLASNLLSQSGKTFYVKYYHLLKNWEITDIVDAIEKNHDSKERMFRIETGKKIFSKKLNLIALQIIFTTPDSMISSETKNRASEILKKEKV